MNSESTELLEHPSNQPDQSDLESTKAAAASRSPQWRFSRWGSLWLTILLLLSALVVVRYRGFWTRPASSKPVQSLPVSTLPLEPVNTYTVSRTYTGEVAARRTSNLGFEQTGTLVNIEVEEGDRITAGRPLATLDTRDLKTQRQQLIAQREQEMAQLQELRIGPRPEDIAATQAAVADLDNQVRLARIQQTRREMLYQEGAISREALDEKAFNADALASRRRQAQSQLDELLAGTRQEQVQAQAARVRQLDARIANIEIQLSKSTLKAPFNGRIAARLMDEGVVVNAGEAVLRLVEDGILEARVGVPAAVAQDLRLGSTQTVQVGKRTYPARMTALLPELDDASRTVMVVLQLKSDDKVAVGQTTRLTLNETQSTAGYWVPSTALVAAERGLWSAYVLAKFTDPTASVDVETAKDSAPVYRVVRRDIEVLHTDGDRVLVRGMLQPGERAIASGVHRVVPGQLVQITADVP